MVRFAKTFYVAQRLIEFEETSRTLLKCSVFENEPLVNLLLVGICCDYYLKLEVGLHEKGAL